MIPGWLNDVIRDFGRQMGLKEFALNERGAAGMVFENGFRLRLEYTPGALLVSIGIAADAEAGTIKKLLMTAHYSTRSPVRIRAFRLGDEARFAVRISEREVSVSRLEGAYRGLWQLMETFRRSIA